MLYDIEIAIDAIKEIINTNNRIFIDHLMYYGKELLCKKQYACKYYIYIKELEEDNTSEYKQNIINHILTCDSEFNKIYSSLLSKKENTPTPIEQGYLLLEDGGYLLLEDGGKIII